MSNEALSSTPVEAPFESVPGFTDKPESKTTSKKEKKAEAAGRLVVDSQPEEIKETKKPERPVEPQNEPSSETPEHESEATDVEKLAEFDAEDLNYVEQELAKGRQQELAPQAENLADGVEEEVDAAGEQAVAEFTEDVANGMPIEEAKIKHTQPANEENAPIEADVETEMEPTQESPEPDTFETPTPDQIFETETDESEDSLPPPTTNGGGSSSPPPARPTARSGGNAGSPPPSGNYVPPVAAISANHNANPNTYEPQYHESNPATMALFGGIVGYLIGRRRGRIKTEKRLLPVQERLKKQVAEVQSQLFESERQVRHHARAEARRKYFERHPTEKPKPVVEVVPTAPVAAQETVRTEKEPRSIAPEATALHGATRERIGHILVEAQAPLPKNIERSAAVEKIERQVTPPTKKAETMNRVELMSLSEKIVIDGTSLRQIYETRLVGERGLRRLVAEHLRGGDLKRVLRREITEREIDFERDPVMRDQPSGPGQNLSGGGSSGRASSLDQLLEQRGVAINNDEDEIAFLKARAAYEDQEQVKHDHQRKVMDISLVAVIATLIAAVIVLAITHR